MESYSLRDKSDVIQKVETVLLTWSLLFTRETYRSYYEKKRLAQLVERQVNNLKVTGSNPVSFLLKFSQRGDSNEKSIRFAKDVL